MEYTDTQLLDFLQEETKGYGEGWVCRVSNSGRGMRLHETKGVAGEAICKDIRMAIIKYKKSIESNKKIKFINKTTFLRDDLVRKGLQKARNRQFSGSPPDIDGDRKLADRMEE